MKEPAITEQDHGTTPFVAALNGAPKGMGYPESGVPRTSSIRDSRECACPPWVLRCAHFESASVSLVDGSMEIPGCVCGTSPGGFQVVGFDGPPRRCPNSESCQAPGFWRWQLRFETVFCDDEAEALAAFYTAEERLLAEASA